MGLSNEERYRGIIMCNVEIRETFDQLYDLFKKDQNNYAAQIVRGWQEDLDLISGLIFSHLSTNTAYWLLGPNDLNYKSIFNTDYNFAEKDDSLPHNNPLPGSLGHLRYISLLEFIKKLVDNFPRACLITPALAIGHLWSINSFFECLLYNLYRYRDGLLENLNIENKILSLIGKISNERFKIMKPSYIPEAPLSETLKLEQILFCKYDLYIQMIAEKHEELLSQHKELIAKKEENPLVDFQGERIDVFDAIYNRIFNDDKNIMTYIKNSKLSILTEDLENRNKRNREKRHDNARDLDIKIPVDPIFGPSPEKEEVLVEKINAIRERLRDGKDISLSEYRNMRKEYNEHTLDIRRFYGPHYPNWESVVKFTKTIRKEPKEPKKPKKLQREKCKGGASFPKRLKKDIKK